MCKTETAYVLYNKSRSSYYCIFGETPSIHSAMIFNSRTSAELYTNGGFKEFEIIIIKITIEL
jgi:hypothetical protein